VENLGPIQMLTLAFPGNRFKGEILPELDRLKGEGIVRVIDMLIVRKDAQKIDSRQSSRNLLLSPTAEIDTRPELEIYANDVKCSHGATTGQLDANALFYLRSRGVSDTDARALLIRAFAESILASIESQPVKQYLEQRLNERFGGSSQE